MIFKQPLFCDSYNYDNLAYCIQNSLPDDLISIDFSKFSKNLSGKWIHGRYTGKTVVPYYSRRQIEVDPDFAGKAKPVAWVNDNRGFE